jgi:drug/metabolite transporter (DMT)-like permease
MPSDVLATTATTAKRAILLILASIFFLSLMDACVKAASPRIGTFPALWARYSGQFLVVLLLVAPRLRTVVRTQNLGLHFARSLLLLTATFCFFNGLSRIGLAEATAVIVMNPLFITLGGALFLGEALGLRRIVAIVIAFFGAMLVIQPGTAAFQPAALFPLAAAICFAGYALITRAVGKDEDVWTSLFYTALVGGVLMTVTAPLYWVWPDPFSAALMLGIAVTGTIGQLLMIRAYAVAEAGLLAPFGYSGMIYAILIGLVAFNEIPGWNTLAGAGIIAAAGIYVWWRETRAPKS